MRRLLTKGLMHGVVLWGQLEAAVLPGRWLYAIGRFFARRIVSHSRVTREALNANARYLLPDADEERLRAFPLAVVSSFCRLFVSLLRAPRDYPDAEQLLATMEGREHGARVLEMGRGTLIVTLHLGPYEQGGALAGLFQPAAMVYRPDPYHLVEKLRAKSRDHFGVDEITTDRPLFGVEVLNRLRAGGSIMTAIDIGFEAGEVGEIYPFLGGRARFHTWAARVSLASGAVILPSFVVWDENDQPRMHLEPPILPEEAGDVDAVMERLIAIFERIVRTYPEQWLILHRYWIE